MSHDHVTGEEVVYIARALKANFPILTSVSITSKGFPVRTMVFTPDFSLLFCLTHFTLIKLSLSLKH